MKNPFESSCRRRASWGLWLHLPESSQEFVSNEGTSGTSFLLSINSNPRWVCAIYVWSFAISVGRDRKIDIYSVSTKENTWALGIIWVLEIPFQLFLQFLHPSKVVHPICICLHCYYQQKKKKRKEEWWFSSHTLQPALNFIRNPDDWERSVHIFFAAVRVSSPSPG